ncbi:MAG: PAS domain-containing protein [Anaerolineae bacterium]|nr:PAS domain-containing protein [Anaerolineae bacterium]
MATPVKKTRFISLRWRFTVPLFAVILTAAMVGSYFLGARVSGTMDTPQVNLLLQSSRAINQRAAELYAQTRTEAQRLAFTQGVADALGEGDADRLLELVDAQVRLSRLDAVTLVNRRGAEVLSLLRTETADGSDYAVNSGTLLDDQPLIEAGMAGEATGISRTNEGYMVFVSVPVDGEGAALVGWRLGSLLESLKGSGLTEVALYGEFGTLLQTTLAADAILPDLQVGQEVFKQALALGGAQVPVQSMQLNGKAYQGAYFPFQFGSETLGVIGAFAADNIPLVTAVGRQFTGLMMAAVAGAVVIGAFLILQLVIVRRVTRVTRVAHELTTGNSTARTNMQPADEIGKMGQALDQYANYVQERQDSLRQSLRRQRRETEHLTAVLESLPDGIIVQDVDGRVVMMNEQAKTLLGSQRNFRNAAFHDLTTTVTDGLGPAIAPGIYSLGDPQRVELDGKMLSAQAAAVMNMADVRVGTVVVLRDVTLDVRRQRLQERVLHQMEQQVQKPLAEQAEAARQALSTVAKELTRQAVTLQKLVVEMRDLNMPDAPESREGQRALHLDTLIWAVANEWRQVAAANNLTLDVGIAQKGLYVLGDERRLRWAIGNLVDNAVKYTPPGGKLMLEIQGESNGRAQLRVRDNGVGIAPEELTQVFTRFYRGIPTTQAGRVISAPGTGQGLTIAKQIIEGHGGSIQIKSKVGVGTAVYFMLPLTAAVSMTLPHLQMDMEGETVRLETEEM